jgi:hypothetical protein
MTTEVKPNKSAIEEAQARLAQLAEEEANMPAQKGAKEQALAEAQARGDFQRAAVISAELDYLFSPHGESAQRVRIKQDREAAELELRNALADEMDKQADELEVKIPPQKAKEHDALTRLEAISGCKWVPEPPPRYNMGTVGGAPQIVTVHIPLSKQYQNGAERRRELAKQLRLANPIQTVIVAQLTAEALAIVE